MGKWVRWPWCWLMGHDWVYLYSFTASISDCPFGGFRICCTRCRKACNARYPEHMEIRVKGGQDDG